MSPSNPARPFRPFPGNGLAVIVGASGGIGAALVRALPEAELAEGGFSAIVSLSRAGDPPLDLLSETSIAAAAARLEASGAPLRLVVDATGFLHGDGHMPERSLREIDPDHLARAFAINAIGPALLAKHFLPLFPREGKAVFATLSARVGSIADNRLGGWHAYRASKAALNQIVRTAAVELARRRPEAVCVAVHPGTVDTALSAPFARTGLEVRTPTEAARRILALIGTLGPGDNGTFLDTAGHSVPW